MQCFRCENNKRGFLKTRSVGWEIFPAGSLERAICYATSQIEKTDEVKKELNIELNFFNH